MATATCTGSYTFTWEQPADEVFVTGTFDNWTKSEKLDKIGDIFKKTVHFKDASAKVYYKFVVDHAWIINESSPKEADHEGNVNNFLTPEDMASEQSAAPVIATVTAESTTAVLAGAQPIEKKDEQPVENDNKDVKSEKVVEEHRVEERKDEKKEEGKEEEKKAENVETVATPSDIPGGFPVTPNDLDKTVSINPLPAADGAANPIKLPPGEPVPAVFTQDINSNVKLDEASYEKADALPGGLEASGLQAPAADAIAAQISTIGETTLALAAEVPLESKVPEIVKESQEEAGLAPEASAIPEEVREKAEVEKELIEKVPEAPAASESVPAEVAAAPLAEEPKETSVETAAAEVVSQEEKKKQEEEVVSEAPVEAKEPTKEADVKAEAAAVIPAAEEKKTEEEEEAVFKTEVMPQEAVFKTEVMPQEAVFKTEVMPQEAAFKTEVMPQEAVISEETKKLDAASAASDAAKAPEAASGATESTEPAKSETAATEEAQVAAPAAEALTAAPTEPESSGPTQVEEPAAAAAAEAAPAAEGSQNDGQPETPKSEATEVSPNAEANGTEEKASTPSDKKKQGRLTALFRRFKLRFSNP